MKAKKTNPYSGIAEEVKFILRYLDFHDKILYKNAIGIFIDDLQKAITDKKISKTSPVAGEIMELQESAINAYNSMRNAKHIMLRPETIKKLKGIVEKYENSYEDIDEKKAKDRKKKKTLNGLELKRPGIISSVELANMKFKTLGFKGKWLAFIGDPSPGFTVMVYGMPKMGKSFLCIDFASYLSKNHGRVLYISKEEFMTSTLGIKINEMKAANHNLDFSETVPSDLSAYQFVFIDSVTSLKLSPEDLKVLEKKYPGISFVYVFQVTKDGKARGTNEFMHNVDSVIELPEKGAATQNGRFNQGGVMKIFEDSLPLSLDVQDSLPTLAGINEKSMKTNTEKTEKELSVKIAHNSWGDVAVIKKGSEWAAILQPEDIELVGRLRVSESCNIRDEKGHKWKVSNNGKGFTIQSNVTNYKGNFRLDEKYLNPGDLRMLADMDDPYTRNVASNIWKEASKAERKKMIGHKVHSDNYLTWDFDDLGFKIQQLIISYKYEVKVTEKKDTGKSTDI